MGELSARLSRGPVAWNHLSAFLDQTHRKGQQ